MKRFAYVLIVVMSLVVASCKSAKVVPPQHTEDQRLKEQLMIKEDEINSLQRELETCKSKLAVYEFFNDESISIFSNNTIEEKGGLNILTGKNRAKYETIRMIADVENRLTQISNVIQQLNKQQQSKKWSDVELRNAIKLEIKAEMESIGSLLDTIDKRDLSDFSKTQMDYYRKQSKRYDDFEGKYL